MDDIEEQGFPRAGIPVISNYHCGRPDICYREQVPYIRLRILCERTNTHGQLAIQYLNSCIRELAASSMYGHGRSDLEA